VTCNDTEIQATTAINTENRFFTLHKDVCRKTYGKEQCTLNPIRTFDPTKDVDSVTS